MAEPFIGEIRNFSFPFPPQGWALCAGQTMAINQNQVLFSILGTTYGGDGVTTFKLPNLCGRTPVHPGNGVNPGQAAGEEAHVLTVGEMPAHNHTPLSGSGGPVLGTPQGNTWGTIPEGTLYAGNADSTMHPSAITAAGGGQGHSNMQPYLATNYCIAITGIYPSRN